jgi:hypothetical protein
VALTVEAGQTRRGEKANDETNVGNDEFVLRRPLESVLTTAGYCLKDPTVPNRLSIWFTGGSLKVQDDGDAESLSDWKQLFNQDKAPSRTMTEFARLLAARILVGADQSDEMSEDGTIRYTLRRPIGGHGRVFCDVVYADESLRILKGHKGSLYVFARTHAF